MKQGKWRMKTRFFSRISIRILLITLIITALGLMIRVWGSKFGFPYIYHYDEHFYVSRALYIAKGDINHPPFAPTGFTNILLLDYVVYFVLGKLFGIFNSPSAFEALYRADPSSFYFLARLTSALFGTLTIPVIIAFKNLLVKINDQKPYQFIASGMAGVMLAFAFLHVRDSHYATPDIATSFFVILAVFLFYWNLTACSRFIAFLGGFSVSAAISMKWIAAPVVIPMAIYTFSILRNSDRRKAISLIAFSIVGLLLGFLILSPQIILAPHLYLNEFVAQFNSGQGGGFDDWQVDVLPGWLFYGSTLSTGVGIIMLCLSVFGFLIFTIKFFQKRSLDILIFLSFPVTYYLIIGSTMHYFARYALPLIPFLVLFAAESLLFLATRTGTLFRKREKVFLVLFALIAVAQPLLYSIQHDRLLTRKDTRTEAKEWIETTIPEGKLIAMDWVVHTPPLSTKEDPVPNSRKTYELIVPGNSGLYQHPIAWYGDQGVDYLVTTSFISELNIVNAKQNADRHAFYSSINHTYKLIKEFNPSKNLEQPKFIFDEIYGPIVSVFQRKQPGPAIKVYQVH
jgi:hypothetical protein